MDLKTVVFGSKELTESQEKKRKLFMYLVSGGITTVANWVVYIIVDLAVKNDMMMSVFGFEFTLKYGLKQIIGWIVAVIVAYPLLTAIISPFCTIATFSSLVVQVTSLLSVVSSGLTV